MTKTTHTIHIADAHFIEKYGIEWGGFTSTERKELKKKLSAEISDAVTHGNYKPDPKGYIEIESHA